ncbi:Hypothetical predicted protein [Cloeon dipterum]|uniref:Uncharacterized protein n=1 Tax=Cloeon dipterum TaxID=197152 RepID=A0A8S1E1X9_9INSE|nr:Hypothetical predicted protein [Cloeon dipterum]
MNNSTIYIARTLHKGYFLPGYAVDGIGFFVSKELQPFWTKDFQVIVDIYIAYDKYEQCHEKAMVSDDGAEESKRIKIGTFIIEHMRFCGLVDDQNTCYINFHDKVHFKEAPEFESTDEMFWINYHKEYLAQIEKDGVKIGRNKSMLPIYLARTLHEQHFVPGYAVNGVGYFVSPDLEQFQTSNFQVCVDSLIDFTTSHERGIVTDEEDQAKRFLIGSFFVENKRVCGLVLRNETCCVNFDGQVVTRYAPHFEFITEFESTEKFDFFVDDDLISALTMDIAASLLCVS